MSKNVVLVYDTGDYYSAYSITEFDSVEEALKVLQEDDYIRERFRCKDSSGFIALKVPVDIDKVVT